MSNWSAESGRRRDELDDLERRLTIVENAAALTTAHAAQIAALQVEDVALDFRLDPLELALRVKGRRTAVQSIASGVATPVDFNAADDFDLTAWHDHTGLLSVRVLFVVPSGGGGTYALVAHVEWAAPIAIANFLLEVTLNGAALTERVSMPGVGIGLVYGDHLTAFSVLAAGDVLKVEVTQTSGVALNLANATFSVVRVSP